MKKIVALFTALIVLSGLLVSCKAQKCAAYGEVHKYQKESRY